MTTPSTHHDDPSITGPGVSERARPLTATGNTAPVHTFSTPELTSGPPSDQESAGPPFHSLTSSSTAGYQTQQHQQQQSINVTNPYNDELSFHTTSYAGSYDTYHSTGSPWPINPSLDAQHARSHVFYPVHNMSQSAYKSADYAWKQDEPILAPGELPAPRPQMSYAALIGEALLVAPAPHQLYVSEISESIKRRYACESPFVLPPSHSTPMPFKVRPHLSLLVLRHVEQSS